MSLSPDPLFDLTGRRAFITGSTRGLGRAMAAAFIARGAQVIIHGRNAAHAAEVAREIGATGSCAFDLGQADVIAEALAPILAAGPIDILINNAGLHRRGKLLDLSLDDWRAVIDTNLTGAFAVARAVVPGMIAQKRGKVINICSLMSELGRPTTGNYMAAKGSLKMLTRAMTVEWAPDNIQANAIGPGYFATDLNAPLMADPKFDGWIKNRTPAGRWGDPTELVGAAVFLASSASDFINGQILFVDGGITAAI
jgi:gluconate 5-dehydrogenase